MVTDLLRDLHLLAGVTLTCDAPTSWNGCGARFTVRLEQLGTHDLHCPGCNSLLPAAGAGKIRAAFENLKQAAEELLELDPIPFHLDLGER